MRVRLVSRHQVADLLVKRGGKRRTAQNVPIQLIRYPEVTAGIPMSAHGNEVPLRLVGRVAGVIWAHNDSDERLFTRALRAQFLIDCLVLNVPKRGIRSKCGMRVVPPHHLHIQRA